MPFSLLRHPRSKKFLEQAHGLTECQVTVILLAREERPIVAFVLPYRLYPTSHSNAQALPTRAMSCVVQAFVRRTIFA